MIRFKFAVIAMICMFASCSKDNSDDNIIGEWKVIKYEGFSETRYSDVYYSDKGSVREVNETKQTEREEWNITLGNTSNIWVFQSDGTLVIYGSDLNKDYSSYVIDHNSDKLLLYGAESQNSDKYDIVTYSSSRLIITKKNEQVLTGSQYNYEDLDNFDRGVMQSKTVIETEETIEFAIN